MEYLKKDSLANRLNLIMKERSLKQVDVLHLAEPFCKENNVKLAKNYLSQYCNGKNEPGKDILNVLSLALQVNPEWLQGFDVPMELPSDKGNDNNINTACKDLNNYDSNYDNKTNTINNENNTKKEVNKMNKITKSSKLDNVLYDVRGPVLDEATRMEEAGSKILK